MSHPVRMTLTRLAFLHAVRAGEVVVDRLGLGRPAYKGLRKVSAQLRELERAGTGFRQAAGPSHRRLNRNVDTRATIVNG